MSDNIQLNAGFGGAVAATEEISGVHLQRVKLAVGASGVDDGDVSTANALPVTGSALDEIETGVKDLRNQLGDVPVAEVSPAIQIDAVYGILTSEHETYTALGGGATAADTIFSASCSSTVASYGVIRSRKALRYRGGQVADFRFTALFDTPVALTQQMAGPHNLEQGFWLGYNGTSFGVMHQHDGKAEIRTLTLSAGAAGTESITVQLNGVSSTFNVTVGTAAVVAAQIAAQSFTGWAAYQNGSTVVFLRQLVGVASGAYGLTNNTGGGTTAGSFGTVQTGVAHTTDWTYQADWNIDKLDGTGASGMTLNKAKLNVYRVQFAWLGGGSITWSVKNPSTGTWEKFHTLRYPNAYTVPSVRNPTFKMGWVAYNVGGASGVTTKGVCGAAFSHGRYETLRRPQALSNSKTGIGTSFTSVLAIRNRAVFAGSVNLSGLVPVLASFAVDGTKPAECRLVLNPTFAGTQNWTYVDEASSATEYDTGGTTITGGQVVLTLSLGKSEARSIDISSLGESLELIPTDVLCLAIKATSGTTDGTAAISWGRD